MMVELQNDSNRLRSLPRFEPAGPKLRIVTTPSFPATPGQPITIEPIADSDVDVSNATLLIDGNEISLDDLGRGTFYLSRSGKIRDHCRGNRLGGANVNRQGPPICS